MLCRSSLCKYCPAPVLSIERLATEARRTLDAILEFDMIDYRNNVKTFILLAAVSVASARTLAAVDAPARPTPAVSASDPIAQAQDTIDKGLAFLKSQQRPDGGWQAEGEPPALTAIALRAFAGDPKSANEPFVQKGFEKLLTFQKEDGSISSDVLATYNTAIATAPSPKAMIQNIRPPSIRPSPI